MMKIKRLCNIKNKIIFSFSLNEKSFSTSQAKKIDSYLSTLPSNYEYLTDSERSKHFNDLINNYVIFNDINSRSKADNRIKSDLQLEIFSYLMKRKGGISLAMKLREDVLNNIDINDIENVKTLKGLDNVLKLWLGNVFCEDALELRRVTFDGSSGDVLEKITKGESVHTIRSLSELKLRLSDGRRCFAFFHESLPNEPLAFIHVALVQHLCGKLRSIYTAKELLNPTHAIFYSVNSPHHSLTGLDLASRLIRCVSHQLTQEFPTIHTFSTLSPIPDFMNWLAKISQEGETETFVLPEKFKADLIEIAGKGQTKKALNVNSTQKEILRWLHGVVTDQQGHSTLSMDESFSENLKDSLMWLAAHYLTYEKMNNNLPRDPVARFHLRNGASLHNLTWMGNPSIAGLTKSAGIMVNYVYDIPLIDNRAALFQAEQGSFHYSDEIKKILNRQIYK